MYRLQAQMPPILGKIRHGTDKVCTGLRIKAVDHPNTQITISSLIGIATEVMALPLGDSYPQLTDFPRFVRVTRVMSSVEE
ncbi:hypothetical protein ACXPVS_06050 [Pseudomonas sp. Ma2-10]